MLHAYTLKVLSIYGKKEREIITRFSLLSLNGDLWTHLDIEGVAKGVNMWNLNNFLPLIEI
jgi:hypothetical protein